MPLSVIEMEAPAYTLTQPVSTQTFVGVCYVNSQIGSSDLSEDLPCFSQLTFHSLFLWGFLCLFVLMRQSSLTLKEPSDVTLFGEVVAPACILSMNHQCHQILKCFKWILIYRALLHIVCASVLTGFLNYCVFLLDKFSAEACTAVASKKAAFVTGNCAVTVGLFCVYSIFTFYFKISLLKRKCMEQLSRNAAESYHSPEEFTAEYKAVQLIYVSSSKRAV